MSLLLSSNATINASALHRVKFLLLDWRVANRPLSADIDDAIAHVLRVIEAAVNPPLTHQQAWERAVGELNFWIGMLEAIAVHDKPCHAFVCRQKAHLIACGVLA